MTAKKLRTPVLAGKRVGIHEADDVINAILALLDHWSRHGIAEHRQVPLVDLAAEKKGRKKGR
jgi:hypothetical protein